MVALNENFAPEKTVSGSKNRVGNFFSGTPDCVGSDHSATRNRIGEKRPCSYDFASGVTYYGFRYYDPVTGRWPNRDPIEELGHNVATIDAETVSLRTGLLHEINILTAQFFNILSRLNGISVVNSIAEIEEAISLKETLFLLAEELSILETFFYDPYVYEADLVESSNPYWFILNQVVGDYDYLGLKKGRGRNKPGGAKNSDRKGHKKKKPKGSSGSNKHGNAQGHGGKKRSWMDYAAIGGAGILFGASVACPFDGPGLDLLTGSLLAGALAQ